MSCTTLSPAMKRLLEDLRAYPNIKMEPLRGSQEWSDAVSWGWVMESGELTGTGSAHTVDLPGGLVRE